MKCKRPIEIPAEPQAVAVDLERTAVIVVDMQNAFISEGGMWDIRRVTDMAKIKRVITPIKEVLGTARNLGLRIFYIRMAYRQDLSDAGNVESPNYWKEPNFHLLREKPSYREKGPISGTWGSHVIDEIKPRADEIIITKSRYSGFFGTELDSLLKSFNIKFLLFMGVATNICVESTIRDAFHKEYWPILLSDCCMAIGMGTC